MMDGGRPRDWNRFEREMRVWGRRFERDMCAWGARMERDMRESGAHMDWDRDPDWDWDKDRDGASARWAGRARRARWCGPAFMWGFDPGEAAARRSAWRAERRVERAARRAASRRAREDGVKCGRGGFRMWWIFGFWWLVFPLYGLLEDVWRDIGGGRGIAGAIDGMTAWAFEHSVAGAVANVIDDVMGIDFMQALALLALAATVWSVTIWLGLRRPLPARR